MCTCTIIAHIIAVALANAGVNRGRTPIRGRNWRISGAPFVDGGAGFAHVFVTASFACGGTESLDITAGETKSPTKNMPRVVRVIFWRILLFYILSILMISLNAIKSLYDDLAVSIVFGEVGSNVAASFMNTVILTSVLSAGNYAYAGTCILYPLSTSSPRLAPRSFSHTTSYNVPLRVLLGTASISALCFASSSVGSWMLLGWLQNIVKVMNQNMYWPLLTTQIAWLCISIASWRFRKAWIAQGRPLSEMKYRAG
ncbi:uncharacterized protein FOMMEDRAFT_170393 [Fomitiporia mediterranea MF3/22]|uniref:uncharacterized protein n=1 Tax=Fomitiporia mediterranea (strain MF3/22) TaxID=694068 RepID=UPI0004408472|nr:uncharacterized protein FOMMEDRAFT_170393 [Fomitiporia mediterranea MF3/22]EJC99884.1 hypothetical protein FOMMEDRAFT_170393 [Fomitiporia mediterranea MF3/22]